MIRLSLVAAVLTIQGCTAYNIITAPIDAIVRNDTTLAPISRAADRACLQEAIYFESGNSDLPGRAAVAHVIMNLSLIHI